MVDCFSKRFGYRPPPEDGLVYEDAPKTLRIGFWNLLEDFIKEGCLHSFYSLYDPYTTQLRIVRSDAHDKEKSVLNMIENCHWYQFYDLCELTFTQMQDADYYGDTIKTAKQCRYDYTVKLNKLLSEEHIGWQLRKGRLRRISSETLDKDIIQPACILLKNPLFSGPDRQFTKALGFFNKRPQPDIENCIKEAVGALEAVAKILTKKPKDTLGKVLPYLIADGTVKKPLNKIIESVYGFRGDQPGVAHAQYKPSTLDIAEAEFVLHTCASAILFLGKKFDIKQTEVSSDDDIPF